MIWVIIWLVCGILADLIVVWLDYEDSGLVELTLKEISCLFVFALFGPLALFSAFIALFRSHKDVVIVRIINKRREK